MPLIRAELKTGGHPVKDAGMDTAPSHARTRRPVRKIALRAGAVLRRRLIDVTVDTMGSLTAAAHCRPIHSGCPGKA